MVLALHTSAPQARSDVWATKLLHPLLAPTVWANRPDIAERSRHLRHRCFQRDSQDWNQVPEERMVPAISQFSQSRHLYYDRPEGTWPQEEAFVALFQQVLPP